MPINEELVSSFPHGSQEKTVFDAIDSKHRLGKVVIVDKKAAKLTAYRNAQKQFSFSVLLGSARRDGFNRKISAFRQKITPATYYKKPQLMYHPSFPKAYKEQVVINFEDVIYFGNKSEVLSLHTTLSSKDDQNINDGFAGNNRLSNGCIRMKHRDFLKLVAFMSSSGNLSGLRSMQKKQTPQNLSLVSAIVVLPERARSASATRSALGL